MTAVTVTEALPCCECTGCGACAIACPVGCIEMKGDREGFLIPAIGDGCVRCGQCIATCPCLDGSQEQRAISEGWMMAQSNRSASCRSSSGGVFYGLARWMIEERGGVVAGAVIGFDGYVEHRIVDDVRELAAMQGSKYVQSDAISAMRKCRAHVQAGRFVLFSGTPCQVAAMKSLVGPSDLLFTVELICHGVPSPGFWVEHVCSLREQNPEMDPSRLLFRVTNRNHRTSFCLDDQASRLRIPWERDIYYALFVQNMSLRECCYTCRYARPRRVADLVIGDCAASSDDSSFHPCDPVSAVFPIGERGAMLLSEALADYDRQELDVQKEIRLNIQLSRPTIRPPIRDDVYSDLRTLTEGELAEKYLPKLNLKSAIKDALKAIVPVRWRVRILRALRH